MKTETKMRMEMWMEMSILLKTRLIISAVSDFFC